MSSVVRGGEWVINVSFVISGLGWDIVGGESLVFVSCFS